MMKIRSTSSNFRLNVFVVRACCLGLICVSSGLVIRAQTPVEAKPQVATPAANQVELLHETDEERAVKILESYGERIFRRNGSPITVLQITKDQSAQQLIHFPDLRMVSLSGPLVTDDALSQLTDLRSLRSISIRNTSITDDGLRQLSKCQSLQSLELQDRVINESLVAAIGQIQGLRTLQLATRIGAVELEHLAGLPKLPSLSLSDVVVSPHSVDALNQLFQIDSVSLSVSKADDKDCAELEKITLPATLLINRSPAISSTGWAAIARANFSSISINQCDFDDEDMKAISASNSLKSLLIAKASVTDEGLTHLYGNKTLLFVSLRDTSVTAPGVADLVAALPHARIFNYEGANIVANNLADADKRRVMSGSPSVSFLAMPGATHKSAHVRDKIDDQVIKALKAEPALSSVFAVRGDPTDGDIAKLKELSMTGLVIQSDAISSEVLAAFNGHRSLAEVAVTSTKITDQAVEAMLALPALTQLSLQDAQITDEGMQRLIAGLAERSEVKCLKFSGCKNLTNDAFKGIDQLKGLQQLFLNDNPGLTSQVFREFGKIGTLQEIRFGGATIDPADIDSIADLKLDRLHFAKGKLNDEVLARVADAFPSLTQIGLADSDVSDDAMKSIAKLRELQWIFMQGTNVSEVGLQHLQPLKKLKYVFASRRTLSPEAVERFHQQHPDTKLRLN